MNCAWTAFLELLPPWMRAKVDNYGKDTLQELRLRINAPPELNGCDVRAGFSRDVMEEDLRYCVNAASKFSPWTASTLEKGYLTAPGGHRIGICGQSIYTQEKHLQIQQISSLCIRVARDFPGIAGSAETLSGSILILGAPGWGKTTLLRDLSRSVSRKHTLSVVDERNELFPAGIPRGRRMDVLSGVPKTVGIEMLLRTMGPHYIASDEITAQADCDAMMMAANCGVQLLATAHAGSAEDYYSRPVYRDLVKNRVFTTLLVLRANKTFTVERMTL